MYATTVATLLSTTLRSKIICQLHYTYWRQVPRSTNIIADLPIKMKNVYLLYKLL